MHKATGAREGGAWAPSPWTRPQARAAGLAREHAADLEAVWSSCTLSTRTQISTNSGKQFGNDLQEPAYDRTHQGMPAWVSTLCRQSDTHHPKWELIQPSTTTFVGHLMIQEWAPGCMFNYKKSKTQNYKNFKYI